MRTIAIVLAALLIASAFSAGPAAATATGSSMKTELRKLRQSDPRLAEKVLQDPHRQLAVAYLRSVMQFAKVVQNFARSGEIPVDLSRKAVNEMVKNLDQVNQEFGIHFEMLPDDQRKKIQSLEETLNARLEDLKTHVTQLTNAVNVPTPDPKEVMAHVKPILGTCDSMCSLQVPGRSPKRK